MRVAIFDFDGTLYAKETFQILMNHLKNHPIYHTKYRRFFRNILPSYIGYKLRLYPEGKMKERSMKVYLDAFEQLSKDELDTYFGELTEEMQRDFNPLVVSRLKQHVENNVYTMLVTGAYMPLAQSVTEGLDFDTIIGTEIPLNNESIDSKLPIYHIQGKRKNEMIEATLQGKDIDWPNSFAYGDSYSDLSVLELVGNPVAVQPEPRLRAVAEERGWIII